MKERLISLLKDSPQLNVLDYDGWKQAAEWLIAQGVIVPPCKVGDTVYYPWIYGGQCGIAFSEVESIKVYVNGLPIAVVEDWQSDMPMPIAFTIDDFGKTVFLTKEEAEKSIKGETTIMIKHRYKAKICDICGTAVAVKKKLFYTKNSHYVTLPAEFICGQRRVHLCYECWTNFRYNVKTALAERSEGK